ncbi:MAG: helix-turn-helix transcriptional regulator [Paracoccaceae bacterium]|jgi:ribosome-binding protein aMBF1 (putative translation factor)|nr:helix-turn-helix transcriptional regulator [Paracoccaceae bacterium]
MTYLRPQPQGFSEPARRPDYWTQLALVSAGASPVTAWRHAANMSQRELAQEAGIEVETLLQLESRALEATPEQIRAIAWVLGLREGDLRE